MPQSPFSITRNLEFDAGHRVLGHTGKCRHLHGHRYKAEITVTVKNLDELGMVIDFSAVKSQVGIWIDRNWDHNLILHPEDPLWDLDDLTKYTGDRCPYIMPSDRPNPTAENLAAELHSVCHRLLPNYMSIPKVVIWETPNCRAEFSES